MNVPAHLLSRPSRNLAQAAIGLNKIAIPRISILGSRFTLIDGAGNEKPINTLTLNVVIVDMNANMSKVYYGEAYDPANKEFKPPTCFSDNGLSPSKQSKEPQHANCATCLHNVWGSSINAQTGKQSKECQDKKKLAVLVPGEGGGMVFQLVIPPGSLKALGAYAMLVSSGTIGNRPVDLSDVVTQISFPKPNTLGFQAIEYIDDDIGDLISRLDQQTEKLDILVGRTEIVANTAALIPAQTSKSITYAPKVYSGLSDLEDTDAMEDTPAPREVKSEPARSRGRPSATKSKAPQPDTSEIDELPAFMQANFSQSQPKEKAATKQNSNFGISTNLTSPDSALDAAIADAFNLSV